MQLAAGYLTFAGRVVTPPAPALERPQQELVMIRAGGGSGSVWMGWPRATKCTATFPSTGYAQRIHIPCSVIQHP